MPTNSDFDKYVNSLNDITNQENRAELESFYSLNSAALQFFNAIDKSLQEVLNKPNVGATVLKRMEAAFPLLTRLKREITTLDTNQLSVAYKNKIDQIIGYIKKDMTIGEVNVISNDFWDLLKENEIASVAESKEKKRKEQEKADIKAKEEKERLERVAEEKESELKNKIQKIINDKWRFSTDIYINEYNVSISIEEIGNNVYKLKLSSDIKNGFEKDYDFKKLGFERDRYWYCKYIPLSNISIEQIVKEIKIIFETIYKVKFQNYKIR